MEAASSKTSGFISAAASFVEGVLGSAQNRIQLLSVELQEEKLRLIQIVVLVAAAIFAGMMTIAFASMTVVYIFWENARIAAMGGVAAFYLIGFVILSLKLKSFLGSQPKPFEATLAELEKDRACILPKS